MCKSPSTDDKTVSDRSVVSDPFQNFGGSNHITGTDEPEVVKFCSYSSCGKNDATWRQILREQEVENRTFV